MLVISPEDGEFRKRLLELGQMSSSIRWRFPGANSDGLGEELRCRDLQHDRLLAYSSATRAFVPVYLDSHENELVSALENILRIPGGPVRRYSALGRRTSGSF